MIETEGRLFFQDIYKILGIGIIITGNVTQGTIRKGMKLNINGKVMIVNSIESHHQQLNEATQGSNIGINLSNPDYDALKSVHRTEITFSDEDYQNRLIQKSAPAKPEGAFSFLKKIFKN